MGVTEMKVLILDTNIFVAEIGLTSKHGSALKHYLFRRGMRLFVPEVVADECKRKLIRCAEGKRRRIKGELKWMGRFCGGVSGWQGPNDQTIAEHAGALSRGDHLGAVVVPETPEVRRRAEVRNEAEQPPSHKASQLADCRIWEQCLELLAKSDVVFVSRDADFRGHRQSDKLHPTLRAEAAEVAEDRSLAFHQSMESLLSELRSEIQPIPDSVILAFVYESIAPVVQELESNSGCYAIKAGEVIQTLLTTDQAEVIEVRLQITDIWESADRAKTMDFRLSGSCHYRLAEAKLCDLTPSQVTLLTKLPDGSVRAVAGSYASLSGHAIMGEPPIRPEPAELEI